MNITDTKCKSFAHGYTHFCTGCKTFSSAQIDDSCGWGAVNYCPCCGDEKLLTTTEELLDFCEQKDTDPVNFYKAFPREQKIPNSRTGATPRQVEWIVNCVMADKAKHIPVTIESLTSQLGYYKEIVEKVFKELNITETEEYFL